MTLKPTQRKDRRKKTDRLRVYRLHTTRRSRWRRRLDKVARRRAYTVGTMIHCRRTIEDLRRISRVARAAEREDDDGERARWGGEVNDRKTAARARDIILWIDLSLQSATRPTGLYFETRPAKTLRWFALGSGGGGGGSLAFAIGKPQDQSPAASQSLFDVCTHTHTHTHSLLSPYLSTELAAAWTVIISDGRLGPRCNPQPLSRQAYARAVNRLDDGLMRQARPIDRKRRFLIVVRGLISRDQQRLPISECSLLNNVVGWQCTPYVSLISFPIERNWMIVWLIPIS